MRLLISLSTPHVFYLKKYPFDSLNVNKITIKPQYWKYRSEASFALNQASLTNWVKGGESSTGPI
jgi:hypothetical protein